MAVRLEATIKRFIGLSTDQKPQDAIPAGSSFLESDTGIVHRFDGRSWMPSFTEEKYTIYFEAMIELLTDVREILINL